MAKLFLLFLIHEVDLQIKLLKQTWTLKLEENQSWLSLSELSQLTQKHRQQ